MPRMAPKAIKVWMKGRGNSGAPGRTGLHAKRQIPHLAARLEPGLLERYDVLRLHLLKGCQFSLQNCQLALGTGHRHPAA